MVKPEIHSRRRKSKYTATGLSMESFNSTLGSSGEESRKLAYSPGISGMPSGEAFPFAPDLQLPSEQNSVNSDRMSASEIRTPPAGLAKSFRNNESLEHESGHNAPRMSADAHAAAASNRTCNEISQQEWEHHAK